MKEEDEEVFGDELDDEFANIFSHDGVRENHIITT